MKSAIVTWMLIVCFASAGATAQNTGADEHAVNGGFEQDAAWDFMAAGGCQSTGAYDAEQHHTGRRSFKLTNKTSLTPNVYGRVYQIARALKPYTTYRISAWAKGEHAGICWVGGGPGWYLRKPFPTGTFNWTKVSIDYTTDDMPPDFELMVCTESQTQALWVDDVSMVQVGADTKKRDAAMAKLNALVTSDNQLCTSIEHKVREKGGDGYSTLAMAIAHRFLDRITRPKPFQITSMSWSLLQAEEVKTVLDDTAKWLDQPNRPSTPPRRPSEGPLKLDGDVFDVNGKPYFFFGYGHFDSVARDLPNFPSFGASIIQDGRCGPSAMNADGTLSRAFQTQMTDLDTAAHNGMRTDYLLSPHYFPAWAMQKTPTMATGAGGNIGFNIDHPQARALIARWISDMGQHMRDKPALLTVCLSNEPVYNGSGLDKYSRPKFIAYLKAHHKTIAQLNEIYGTHYQSFEDVQPVSGKIPADAKQRPAYFDWESFNKENFANWHAWMSKLVKQALPNVKTHAKEMVFFTFDRDKLDFGVDPELMSEATDLAGCDAYAFMDSPTYAYNWFGHEFFYDLLHSFRKQDVFNSENHLIPDGSPANHIPSDHTRCALWQDGLHHETTTTNWVWEEPIEPSLMGSIYLRPANIYGAGKAMLDLNRLSNEVMAINHQSPKVALLYSPTSVCWSATYQSTIYSAYTQLTFSGQPVTFISERQLADGSAAKVDDLIVPHATNVTAQTLNAIDAFAAAGGHVILIGKDNLSRDEYDRPLPAPARASLMQTLMPAREESSSASALRDLLRKDGLPIVDLLDHFGKHAWGIEYRIVDDHGAKLIPIVNLTKQSAIVKLPAEVGTKAVDLLTGNPIDVQAIPLDPMVPLLLRTE